VSNVIIYMKTKSPAQAAMVSLYRDVVVNALMDLADMNNVSKLESQRDCEEIHNRVANEGLSFLTVALPKLGKALDRALSQDRGALDVIGFELYAGTRIPKFLGVYWRRVFDDTGVEKPDACPLSVKAIRQLVYLLYKLEIPSTREQEDQVIKLFVETDNALPKTDEEFDSSLSPEDRKILFYARCVLTGVFSGFDPRDILPRHGPGAVATGELNHQKHEFKRIYLAIEKEYPFTEYFCYSMGQVASDWRRWQGSSGLRVLGHGTAKVVLVPKDSRGPRLISCEPLEYQWIQQGLGNAIRRWIERSRLCRGFVNFTDQTVNRRLALEGSLGGPWVTLDMKEASDRVSLRLVKHLFQDQAELLNCILATRTRETRLPSGDVHVMNKFAPMGSNLCFPVESIVFYALAVGCLMHKRALSDPFRGKPRNEYRWLNRLLKTCLRSVYVYGDDIVSRKQDYQILLDTFPRFGLMFNPDKCCTHGSFRESCGMDAYKGIPVQPLRLKSVWSVHRKQDAVTLCSYVAFSNAAYLRGLQRTSEFITQLVESETGKLPVMGVHPRSVVDHEVSLPNGLVLMRYEATVTSQPAGIRTRFNRTLHRWEVRCELPTTRHIRVASDDWSMMLRRLTSPVHSGDPGVFSLVHRVKLKWTWIPLADKA
jgi:hypothetical protein